MTYISTFSVFDDYYANILIPREVRQLKNATTTNCDLVTKIIGPMLYNSLSYVCLADHKKMVRHGDYARLVSLETHNDTLQALPFFTNPLRNVPRDDDTYNHPKDRIAICDYHVMTFEFDSKDITFFQQQLGWLRSSIRPIQSPIGRFLSELRETFADCLGLNVTYSGGKSFHFHFVFSTELLQRSGLSFPSLRDGFIRAWIKVRDLIVNSPVLAVPEGIMPDWSLRLPDAFRRTPAALRTADEGHMFAVPAGTPIPQCVVWETIYDRAAKGCQNQSVFDIADFLKPAALFSRRAPSLKGPVRNVLQDTPLVDYLTRCLKHYYPDGCYPQFSHWGDNGGELAAYFSNSPSDTTPDSLIKPDFRTVYLVGTDAEIDNPVKLPRMLGELVEEWIASYELRFQTTDRARSPDEQRFAESATDHHAAVAAIATILKDRIGRAGNHFITAPEGISKSRSLFEATGSAVEELLSYSLPANVMFAFATYALAREKAAEFRATLTRSQRPISRPLKPIVLKSFSRVYRDACDKLGEDVLSTGDAVKLGFNSLYEAILSHQPTVMDHVRSYFQRKRAVVRGSTPVIFTVHDVAHEWQKNNYTRRMFSGAFWSRDQTNLVHRCREDTHLGILVHDEVACSDLVTMINEDQHDWIELLKADSASWASSSSSLSDRWASYQAVKAAKPAPESLTFEEANRLTAIRDWDHEIVTAYSGEYGEPREDDIYAATAGRRWWIKHRDWFDTARTTIILTTETVPTELARCIGDPWSVLTLDTPLLDRDTVCTRLVDRLTSAKLAETVQNERDQFRSSTGRELLCISNRARDVEGTTTHKTAKGSNGFIGRPVLQTIAMQSPQQYEIGEALNALIGRDDMVLLSHLDEFNQSAGRNLGFRFREGAEHHLVINRRLYLLLAKRVLAQARYAMQPVITDHDKRAASRARGKASPALIALRTRLDSHQAIKLS